MALAIYITGCVVAFWMGWVIRSMFGPPKGRTWYIDGKEYVHVIRQGSVSRKNK